MSDWINILGGGFVVGVLNLWYLRVTHKNKCQIEALEKQISHLYGPLHLYCSTNKKLSNISSKLWETVGKYELNEDEEDQTVEVLNQYSSKMKANNEDLVTLLKSNLMYADACDWHVLEVLLVDYTRASIELDSGKLKLHRQVYKDLGPIMFSRAEINQIVSDRYHEKMKQLSKLQGLS